MVINSSPEDKINNDDVDSEKGENEFVVFKNVFNDYYAKDTSKKIRGVVRMRGKPGNISKTIRLTDISKTRRIKRNGW